jgi:tRNA(Arg) A34 adenosine deaminase TadA
LAFLRRAVALAIRNVKRGAGGPFGCVIVRNGKVIATGTNGVTGTNDPTAHAEIVAIRSACAKLGNFELTGCDIYASCEPCPMCLGAIYWARLRRLYFACSQADAARVGFDDSLIYREIALPFSERRIPTRQLLRRAGQEAFTAWENAANKAPY